MASILKVDQIQNVSNDKLGIDLVNGTITYNSNTVGKVGAGFGGFTGNIIQVLQTVKSNTYTTTNTSYEDIPDFFCSISPKYNTSKILVTIDIGALTPIVGGSVWTRLLRGNTEIYSGDGESGALNQIYDGGSSTGEHYYGSFHHTSLYLDSPNTISSITYKVQIKSGGAFTSCFNRNAYDSGSYGGRTASSITLMEVQQ